MVSADLVLISRAFRNNFIIPDFQGFCKYIEEFYWKCKTNTEGKVGNFLKSIIYCSQNFDVELPTEVKNIFKDKNHITTYTCTSFPKKNGAV